MELIVETRALNGNVLQVGTAVVTRADGRLAVGRIGSLCEQVMIFTAMPLQLKFSHRLDSNLAQCS